MNDRLVARRRKFRLTQKKLAELSQITERHIQRLEAGETTTVETAKKIAKVLKCHIEDIF